MPRKPKPPTCKCKKPEGVHEVSCPAFDVDAELDGDVRAPDLVAAGAHTNGASTTLDFDGDDDDDGTYGPDDNGRPYAATVDGDEAIIDTTPVRAAALVPRPSRDEMLDALLRARRVWSQEKTALELQKSKFKLAQMSIDAIVAELAASWEERNQLELPLAAPTVLCANCGLGMGVVPVGVNDEHWCVSCVQANLIPNKRGPLAQAVAEAPAAATGEPADGVGGLGPIIQALSDALRFDDIDDWEKVASLATDPRSADAIAGDLARIAGQHSYSLSPLPPFVAKLAAEELAPV